VRSGKAGRGSWLKAGCRTSAEALKGDTDVLCDHIDHEITLFQQALQDDTTLKRLQRIARLAA